MGKYQYITLREKSDLKISAAEWFNSKWGVPTEAYLECMDAYLQNKTEYGWYFCIDGNQIIGGMGVIENDFHDRKDLTPNVCAVYTDEKYHELLDADLKNYEEKDRLDELHSRIGTEIKTLPDELEKHYAEYFKDQDKIVGFYDSYVKPFNELKAEIEALSKAITDLRNSINSKSTEYENDDADSKGKHAKSFAQLSELISRHWQKHNTLVGFAMDHGCHEIYCDCGSHGLDMDEDLHIQHHYMVYSAK